jgi:hypothetical protein
LVDLIDDRPHRLDGKAGGVGELPVEVALAGCKNGQVSPQPMVTTTPASLAS